MSSTTSTSPQLVLPYDPNSGPFVVKGCFTTGAFGALTGATIGVLQSRNPYTHSVNMSINMSLAGLTFFGLREYLVSPLLIAIEATPTHTRRYHELARLGLSEKQKSKLPDFDMPADVDMPAPTIGQVRGDRVLDSALAGGLSGGLLSSIVRGKGSFGKAAFTAGLIASVLQLSVNQFRVSRLKYLAKNPSASPQLAVSDTSSPSSYTHPAFNTRKADLPEIGPDTPPSLPERMMDVLTKVLPVTKLSNEEYLDTMEKKRLGVNKRLREIEQEEQILYDRVQAHEKEMSA